MLNESIYYIFLDIYIYKKKVCSVQLEIKQP